MIHVNTHDPVKPRGEGPMISLRTGEEGFVGRVSHETPDMITLVFSHARTPSTSLDQLTRKPFHVVRVNWFTFQDSFEIDV